MHQLHTVCTKPFLALSPKMAHKQKTDQKQVEIFLETPPTCGFGFGILGIPPIFSGGGG